MRWPIQVQLLLPMLLIALTAIGMTSGVSGYLGAAHAHRQQEDRLRRVVSTLAEATFPLTERVLEQMSGLSGAEFVLLDSQDRVAASTLDVAATALQRLERVPLEARPGPIGDDRRLVLGDERYLVHRVPVKGRASGPAGNSLVVLSLESQWRAGVREAVYPLLLAGGAAAAAAALLAALVARLLVQPIELLRNESARIAQGDFQGPPIPARNDEIRDLALSIQQMAGKLSQYEQDVRSHERLRVLGQLGAGMAHQLRNSATGARMAIELHQRQCASGGEGESLGVALRQLRLLESYLQRFLQTGRQADGPRMPVCLGALVEEVLELVRPNCVHGKIELEFSRPAETLRVWGDGDWLREMLMNLVLNATDAAKRPSDAPGRVEVELARADGARAAIRVKDSGKGPAGAVQDKLFEPFTSEKPEGAGLGLFVARRIAEAHGGTLDWERRAEMTCFTVELPLLDAGDDQGISLKRGTTDGASTAG